jgi:hypothetical protein
MMSSDKITVRLERARESEIAEARSILMELEPPAAAGLILEKLGYAKYQHGV